MVTNLITLSYGPSQGVLGFSSDGLGHGSTFFFELPLYSEATASVHLKVESVSQPATKDAIVANRTGTSFSSLLVKGGIPTTTECPNEILTICVWLR